MQVFNPAFSRHTHQNCIYQKPPQKFVRPQQPVVKVPQDPRPAPHMNTNTHKQIDKVSHVMLYVFLQSCCEMVLSGLSMFSLTSKYIIYTLDTTIFLFNISMIYMFALVFLSSHIQISKFSTEFFFINVSTFHFPFHRHLSLYKHFTLPCQGLIYTAKEKNKSNVSNVHDTQTPFKRSDHNLERSTLEFDLTLD